MEHVRARDPTSMENGITEHDGIVQSNPAVSGKQVKSLKGAQELADNNRKSAVRFKSLHLLVVGFFLWILLVTLRNNRCTI